MPESHGPGVSPNPPVTAATVEINTHYKPTFPPAVPGRNCVSSLVYDHDNDEVWISVGGAEHGKASVRVAKDLACALNAWVSSVERRRSTTVEGPANAT